MGRDLQTNHERALRIARESSDDFEDGSFEDGLFEDGLFEDGPVLNPM